MKLNVCRNVLRQSQSGVQQLYLFMVLEPQDCGDNFLQIPYTIPVVSELERWIGGYVGIQVYLLVPRYLEVVHVHREKTVSMTRQVKTVTLCVTKLPTIEHEKNRKCGGLSFDSQFYTTDSTAFVVDDCIFTALTVLPV